jgi:hypothetical protein
MEAAELYLTPKPNLPVGPLSLLAEKALALVLVAIVPEAKVEAEAAENPAAHIDLSFVIAWSIVFKNLCAFRQKDV